jgi:hypothetical protein
MTPEVATLRREQRQGHFQRLLEENLTLGMSLQLQRHFA